MFRYRLRTLFVVAAIIALVLGFAVRPLYLLGQRLKAEYTTAYVIREVTRFVELHDGQWPKSWNDIPAGADVQRCVRMRFDVSVDELINNPKLIHSMIVPTTGDYHTYPHADRDLDYLRGLFIRLNDQQKH